MKKILIALLLAALVVPMLCCCGQEQNDVTPSDANEPAKSEAAEPVKSEAAEPAKSEAAERTRQSYVNTEYGFPDSFSLSLFSDGTFSYYEGMLSSTFVTGEWTENDGVVTLKIIRRTIDGPEVVRERRFRREGDTLVVDDAGLVAFGYTVLPNGAVFDTSTADEPFDFVDSYRPENRTYSFTAGGVEYTVWFSASHMISVGKAGEDADVSAVWKCTDGVVTLTWLPQYGDDLRECVLKEEDTALVPVSGTEDFLGLGALSDSLTFVRYGQ